MKLFKAKKQLNVWQFVFTSGKDFRYTGGWRMANIGIFKLTSMPEKNERISRKHYDGFLFVFSFWLPFERF